jgi:rhamnulokinase
MKGRYGSICERRAGTPCLGKPVDPGTIVGELPADAAGRRVQVVAPGTHDTASSVAAIPLEGPDEVFISSGTWSLMGIESPRPYADATAQRLNIANEGGVGRRYRVLKNIVGLWLEQRLREELGGPDHAALVAAAEAAPPWRCLIDPADPRFVNPPSMVAASPAMRPVLDVIARRITTNIRALEGALAKQGHRVHG